MRYSEGRIGRVFVVRLEDGEKLPGAIEAFAEGQGVARGMCIVVGGIDDGGRIVVGPEDGEGLPVVPMLIGLRGVHEILGVGTLFPDGQNKPRLHMHASLGRGEDARTGCIRPGLETWKVGEVILLEIVGNSGRRVKDDATGFELLEP